MSGIQSQTKKIFVVVALREKRSISLCWKQQHGAEHGRKAVINPVKPLPSPRTKRCSKAALVALVKPEASRAAGGTGWRPVLGDRYLRSQWGNENAEPPKHKHQPPHMTAVEVGRSPGGLALAEPIMIEHDTIRVSLTDFRKASKNNNCGGPGSPSEWISWKEACLFRALQEDHSQSGVSEKS